MARKIIPVFIILALMLTSCNLSRTLSQPTQDLVDQAVQGTSMALIMTEAAVIEEAPTNTPLPPTDTAPPPATATNAPPTPTNTEIPCTLKMSAVDVTIMDGTLIYVDEVFDKTWRLTNTGTCTWSADYKLTFSSGDQMEGISPVPIGMAVAPNQQIDLTVKMVAPEPIGTHIGYWQLRSPTSELVGTVWVEIHSMLPSPTLPVIPDWPTLKLGDSSIEVTALQHLLNEYGQTVGVDGVFGNQTRTAVINIQTIAGITADGIVGKKTWKVLVSEMELYKGDSGNGVFALQKLLKNKFGYSLTIDGNYGNATLDAVKAFQENWYLDPDGLVDPVTWQALLGD
jgi:hypothetical protein